MGPELNLSVLANQVAGTYWHGTGVGYGVRGSHLQNLTIRFAGNLPQPIITPSAHGIS